MKHERTFNVVNKGKEQTNPIIVSCVDISAHAKVGNLDEEDSGTSFWSASLVKLVHQAVTTGKIPMNVPLRREICHPRCDLPSNRHQISLFDYQRVLCLIGAHFFFSFLNEHWAFEVGGMPNADQKKIIQYLLEMKACVLAKIHSINMMGNAWRSAEKLGQIPEWHVFKNQPRPYFAFWEQENLKYQTRSFRLCVVLLLSYHRETNFNIMCLDSSVCL